MAATATISRLSTAPHSHPEATPLYTVPDTREAPFVDSELIPSYGDVVATSRPRRPLLVQHTYSHQGIILKLHSRAKNPRNMPLIYSGTEISGEVTWTKSKVPQQLTVTLEAHIEPGIGMSHSGQDPSDEGATRRKAFWSHIITLFSASSDTQARQWPFSFNLPSKFSTPNKRCFGKGATAGKEYSFPPFMQVNELPLSIHYVIQVRAHRGRLKLDHILRTQLKYVPLTYPSRPVSILRYGALQLPHPIADPYGFDCTSTTLLGSLPNRQQIQIQCQLYLASPSEYARGSFIPFFVKLRAPLTTASLNKESQQQAVDILASNGSLKPQLLRIGIAEHLYKGTVVEMIASGKMWKVSHLEDDTSDGSPARWLQGEVFIPRTAVVDFVFPIIRIEHLLGIAMDAPSITIGPTLRSVSDPVGYAISTPVIVTSARRPGDPPSISYAPAPGYVREG